LRKRGGNNELLRRTTKEWKAIARRGVGNFILNKRGRGKYLVSGV